MPSMEEYILWQKQSHDGVVLHSFDAVLTVNGKALRTVIAGLERDYGRVLGCWVEFNHELDGNVFKVLTMTEETPGDGKKED